MADTPPWEDYSETPVSAEDEHGPWEDFTEAKPVLPKAQSWQLTPEGTKPYAGYMTGGPFSPYREENMREAVESLTTPNITIPQLHPQGTLGKILAGPVNVASGIVEGATSPFGAALMGLPATRVTRPAFAAIAIKQAYDLGRRARQTEDPQDISAAIAAGAFAGLLTRSSVPRRGIVTEVKPISEAPVPEPTPEAPPPVVESKPETVTPTVEPKPEPVPETGPLTDEQKAVEQKRLARQLESGIPEPTFETITPSKDTPLGVNDAGDKLYQRKDGSVYRMRFDRKDRPYGYPDFGGDLAPIEPKVEEQSMAATIQQPSTVPKPGVYKTTTGQSKFEYDPTQLKMTVLPGAKEFVEQDVVPKLEESAKVIGETAKHVQSTLSPPSMSESAAIAAGISREAKAELARKDVQARMQFDDARKSMDKLSPEQSLAFTDIIERGGEQPTKDTQELSNSLRAEFDKRVEQVRALGTGKLQEVRENYFPHIWKDPEAATSWYARILGRRPLRGPGSFLKHRTIDYTMDGVAAGLRPVTWNPIELALLKMHEMDRYVMGQKIFNEFKEKGLVQFSRSDIPPEGMAKINDRIANVVQYRPTTKADGSPGSPERIIRGHWYANEDAARVLNNFLSPGLERYAWYRAVRWTGNTMNLAQLGLSGYHFLFTMIDSSTSKLSLGLEQLTRGDVGKGLANIARGEAGLVGVNQLEYFLKGSKVLKEYTKPGSVGGDYAKIVDSLLAGGGRVEMPKIFKNSSLENFMTALRSGNYPGAVLRAPFAAIQAVSHPLMQIVVPRLKLGAFTDMARYELEKLPPDATRADVRKVMGKVWDSVDNRMGEMVYDNLFWNRTLKDTSFLAVRAVGWNLGTIRELGGGLLDSVKIINRLRAGDPLMTRRMAYVMALPITVGTMGAMYQYAKTGKGPQDLRDYFYPKTGQMLPDGTEERVDFPSYLKDIYSYSKHPFRTITNKLHPLWSTMAQMFRNRDYYGTQIRNPDDPLVKQALQEIEFIGRTFVPFSVKGAERRVGAKESPEIKAESFFGVMPIPAEIARTPAQNKIMEYGIAKMPQGARTPEEQQRAELKRDLEAQLKSPEDYAKAQLDIRQLQRQGKLSRGQQLYEANKLRFQQNQIASGTTKAQAQWLWRFKHLDLNEARQVYNLATPEEKKLFDRDLKLKERKAQ